MVQAALQQQQAAHAAQMERQQKANTDAVLQLAQQQQQLNQQNTMAPMYSMHKQQQSAQANAVRADAAARFSQTMMFGMQNPGQALSISRKQALQQPRPRCRSSSNRHHFQACWRL